MIARLVSDVFHKIGHTWSTDNGPINVSESDVEQMLDNAAGVLYDEPISTTFESGGLIIKKTADTHDVYVYVGSYQ